MFTDKRNPDLAALEGGAPLTDGAQLFLDIIRELPESARRLFATPQGWAAIFGISAAALGLAAVDFDHAQAMVRHNAPDHTNHLGVGLHFGGGENVSSHVDLPSITASGVVPGLGLSEVDVVTRIPLGESKIADALLGNLAAQAEESGVHLAVGAYVVKMSDLGSIPRSSHPDHLKDMRGGFFPDEQTPSGFSPLEIDSRMIVFAHVAETGQPVVALAQSENGDLTGFTGLGDGKLFGLKYGPSGWDHTLGIEVEMNGSMVFQPLIDTRDGRILIPNGQVIDGVSQVAAEGGGGKPLAVLSEFAGYVSPTFEQLQSLVAESEKYTLTSYEDGLLYDGSPIPGLTVDRDGNIILTVGNEQVTLDPADVNFDDEGIDIDGYEWDEDMGGWVEVTMSETAISTTIEGNPFSGEGIELKELNSEITLSTEGDDLMRMADILDQLAKEGKITVKPVTDQRGAMQLGSSADGKVDLLIQPEKIGGTIGWQPMFLVQDYDLSTYRWQDVTTRPVMVGFNNADGGVIFATMMVDGNGDLKVTDWKLWTEGRLNHFGVDRPDKIINYAPAGPINYKGYLPVPLDFADVDACVEYAKDEGMRATCEEIVANRTALRSAYEEMVRTGQVQESLRNGKTKDGKTLVTLLGFTPAHK